ncbi:hypothetical protein Cs7R123_61470 [Catellatospora sp. TT07R-123]|uniref:hypothetical protein n=1 Tax=Catellatospora sp. TT07R-123 TaxID=2733863 RepID=UPI001B225CAE|nr:hypothetical protein [Catellatospora sp. TT07R-123]GHJ48805.1 hypothetical protein Cs7R123_61470 [Catellatospora sp. TT07R-123]
MTTLNGQILGQAERAARAVLDRLLDQDGIDFHRWVALNATNGAPVPGPALTARLAAGLKVAEAEAAVAVEQLTAAGLLADTGAGVEHTAAGAARFQQLRAAVGEVTTRLYGGIPADDLAVAGRVLQLVTARANAELAA